ncbi:MAG TPA: hypothetical protein VK171_06815 [Fimbriimonas sp.]|nr:hypothetical protein [Fimbriimonas sp.]
MEQFPVNESALKVSDSVQNDWNISASGWFILLIGASPFAKDATTSPTNLREWCYTVTFVLLIIFLLGKLMTGLSVLRFRLRCLLDPSKHFCEVAYGVPAFIGTSVRAPWNKGEVSFAGGVLFRGRKRWFAIPASDIVALMPGWARQWLWIRPALRVDFTSPQGYLSSVYLMGLKDLDDPATLTKLRAQMADGNLEEERIYPPTFTIGARSAGLVTRVKRA